MALFSSRSAAADPQRAMTMPAQWSLIQQGAALTDYSAVDANGENALRSIAVGASIDLICSLGSELPIDVYRGTGPDRVKLTTPSNLDDPGDTGQGREDWLYTLLQSWLYRGNAYGQAVEWDARGRVKKVYLFHPDDVYPVMADGFPVWHVAGRALDRQDLFVHRRVNGMAGRLLGQSVIERHAMQVGTSLSAGQYGSQWFTDGAHPSGLLTNSEADIDKDQAATIKTRWLSIFKGTREPAVLGKGWDWRPIQIAPSESQFLETQRFTEAQCARMFGPAMAETLGYETGGSMTYANVVDRRSDLLVFTLNKWLNRAERLLTALLPEPQYVKLNRDALLQSTTLARYEAHSKALADKWKTINEVREIEDMPPVLWGDSPVADHAPVADQKRDQIIVDARTTVEPAQVNLGDTNVDARTSVEPAEVTLPELRVNVEPTQVTVQPPEIRVDAPITVQPQTHIEPSTTRKTIVRDDAGQIVALEETHE